MGRLRCLCQTTYSQFHAVGDGKCSSSKFSPSTWLFCPFHARKCFWYAFGFYEFRPVRNGDIGLLTEPLTSARPLLMRWRDGFYLTVYC